MMIELRFASKEELEVTWIFRSEAEFLGRALRQYLEGHWDAEDVQAHMEKNPIGEPSITTQSPLWRIYSGLISVDQPESADREANVSSNSTLVGDVINAHAWVLWWKVES